VKIGKITAKSRQRQASNHGPKDYYTVYKTQHLALTTIIRCSARFSRVKCCTSRSHIEPVSNKAHRIW